MHTVGKEIKHYKISSLGEYIMDDDQIKPITPVDGEEQVEEIETPTGEPQDGTATAGETEDIA